MAVTVFERDALPDTYEPRKGVPQGRHAHGLLARGREVLDELFPGFSEDAVSQGAIYGDVVDDVLWFNYGVYLHNTPSSLKGLLISRPMLEELVRRSVLRLPNVRLQEQTEILEPICDRIAGRVTGVRAQSPASATEAIDCDLLVDASDRLEKPNLARSAGLRKTTRRQYPRRYRLHDSVLSSSPGTSARQASGYSRRVPPGLALWCNPGPGAGSLDRHARR